MTASYIYGKMMKKLRGKAVINSKVHRTSKIESGSHVVNSTMDRHSFCGYDCQILNSNIGSFCSIANDVIIGGSQHSIDWVSTSPVFNSRKDSVKAKFSLNEFECTKNTLIGNDVWIGNNVLIKQGIVIGDGAVIGMGSVVTKNVMPYSIVAGNPATEIRKRFDDAIIEEFQKIKWWEFTDVELRRYADDFDNPKLFIQKYLEYNNE